MIQWLILITLAALVAVVLHWLLAVRRERKVRRDLRHVVGVPQWWGKR